MRFHILVKWHLPIETRLYVIWVIIWAHINSHKQCEKSIRFHLVLAGKMELIIHNHILLPHGWIIICELWLDVFGRKLTMLISLIAKFMGPTWGPSGADRTQVGPMLVPWTLLSGMIYFRSPIFRWVSERKTLLQCVSNGVASFLH